MRASRRLLVESERGGRYTWLRGTSIFLCFLLVLASLRIHHDNDLWGAADGVRSVQPCPTLAAHASVEISSQVPVAGRTPPVLIGEADECGNHDDLSGEDRAPGVRPEPPRASVEKGEYDDQQHCRGNRDALTPLAFRELSPDLLPASTHRLPSPASTLLRIARRSDLSIHALGRSASPALPALRQSWPKCQCAL